MINIVPLFRGIKNAIAFLTIIPAGMDEDGLSQAANYMPVFPMVGGLIGLLAGICVWLLEIILPPIISGVIGMGILLIITGAHHADGLLDFGDALMLHGTRKEKIEILHDSSTGAGGLLLGILVLMTTALALGSLDRDITVQSLVASEVAAKFSLVVMAAVGDSAFSGMSTTFVKAMHDRFSAIRFTSGLLLSLVLILPMLRLIGVAMLTSVLVTGALMLGISNRQFGGVSGDVMGATNELARMIALLTILVAAKWL